MSPGLFNFICTNTIIKGIAQNISNVPASTVAAWARGVESFDSTGMKDYLAECERLDIVPVTYFLRHSQEKTFIMKNHGLGPLGTKAIAKALEVSSPTQDMPGLCMRAWVGACVRVCVRACVRDC